MFNHEYDDDGHHRIRYTPPTDKPIVGEWVAYHSPSIVNVGPDMYVAYTTYNFPAKHGPYDSIQYPGPYGDVIYKMVEVA